MYVLFILFKIYLNKIDKEKRKCDFNEEKSNLWKFFIDDWDEMFELLNIGFKDVIVSIFRNINENMFIINE